MVSRAERSAFGDWWWTIDRSLLAALAILVLAGLVFLMAGGPPVAERLGLSTFHFVNRQVMFLMPALAILLSVSFLSLRHLRRLALAVYFMGMILILLAFQYGPEIKGAHRWMMLGPLGIQPSEFVKPAFVVLAAWAFSEGGRRKDMPGALLGSSSCRRPSSRLFLQPDFGQTMLVTIVWCGLFFIAGLHWFWVLGLEAPALWASSPRMNSCRMCGHDLNASSISPPAIRSRSIRRWSCVFARRLVGAWPGEGTVKRILPDAHTDFIFAVTAEEFGIVVCMILLLLFAFIVLRGLSLARRSEDTFCRLAATGIVFMFGLQACINMMVNVHLMPAKGMTLPFISYGGSSLLSLALAMGFLIALTRRRPRAEMMDAFDRDWSRR